MIAIKEVLWALAGAWFVLWVVGCASGEPRSSRVLLGDKSNEQYIERNGVVQNLQTGQIGVRRGAWVQDLQTGKLSYTYGTFIEEPAPAPGR